VLSNAGNVQRNYCQSFYFFESAIWQLFALCLFTMCRISKVLSIRPTVVDRLVWLFHDIVSVSIYAIKPTIVPVIGHFFIFCKILQNSAKMSQFREKNQIAWLSSKFCGPRKTVGLTHLTAFCLISVYSNNTMLTSELTDQWCVSRDQGHEINAPRRQKIKSWC